MKKVYFLIIIVVLISGFFIYNKYKSEKIVNEIQQENYLLKDSKWGVKWSELYQDFSFDNFILQDVLVIDYNNEFKMFNSNIENEGNLRLYSPDKIKVAILYFGDEPDSSVAILDLKTNLIRTISRPYCGTPCLIYDGLWVNENRLIVVGDIEEYNIVDN